MISGKFVVKSGSLTNAVLLQNINEVRSAVKANGMQAVKKGLSIFCCLCCCVDSPIDSILMNVMDRVAMPQPGKSEAKTAGFTLCLQRKVGGKVINAPLFVAEDRHHLDGLAAELNEVYVTSNNATLLTGDVPDLDQKAKLWHSIIKQLPEVSRATEITNALADKLMRQQAGAAASAAPTRI